MPGMGIYSIGKYPQAITLHREKTRNKTSAFKGISLNDFSDNSAGFKIFNPWVHIQVSQFSLYQILPKIQIQWLQIGLISKLVGAPLHPFKAGADPAAMVV